MKSENSEMTEKDAISHKKSLIKSIIKDFRKIIDILRFKISKKKQKKTNLKTLRSRLRLDEKADNDKDEDDGEYLEGIISILSGLIENHL